MQPYQWLNDLSRGFLEKDYLLPGQTTQERVKVIADEVERRIGIPGLAKRVEEVVSRGWCSLSSPIWANFANDRGMPISCFGSTISDTTASILSTHAEVGMMSKHGGGTSAYFGNLRGRGAEIKNNGKSSGSVHFMKMFETLVSVVSQGGVRRGSFAAYLPIDHPDIQEFLAIKSEGSPIQDISFGVSISDDWMNSMIEGDHEKRSVWAKILESRANVGYPYLWFTDNVNRGTVDVYKDKDLKITHSNLCLAGNQRVVTTDGLMTAEELHKTGSELTLFNNEKTVSASSMQLIESNANVYKITLANGMTHTVTGYHKVRVRSSAKPVEHISVACSDLKVGDLVSIQTQIGLHGSDDRRDEAFLLGTYQANGTQTDSVVMIDVWEHSFDLPPKLESAFNKVADYYNFENMVCGGRAFARPEFQNANVGQSPVAKKRLSSKCLKDIGFIKGKVPAWMWNCDSLTHWEYIRGLFYADGTVNVTSGNGSPLHLSLSNVNKEFLGEIQLILANLGIKSAIGLLRSAGLHQLPNGKGALAAYECQDCYRLTISNKPDALEFERHIGFVSRKGKIIEDRHYRDNTKKHSKVVSVEYVGKEDVYCCTVESDDHYFCCNGFITHNCSEIALPDSEDESFVCDLLSMNAAEYGEWKGTHAVETAVMILDAVMSEFIEKAEHIPFMEKAVKFAKRHRALGIGVLGWHSLLQDRMIPFESMEAKFLNVELFKYIKDEAYTASARLATLLGEPELLKGYGRRNTTLMAVAPTKSSAFILGQVSQAIEPFRTNYEIQDRAKGKFVMKNKKLVEVLEEKGQNTSFVWDSILKQFGGVSHLDFLSDHEKAVFKTYAEISQKEVLIQAAQRQKFIDQGQSLNIMVHPSTHPKDVNALYIEGWKMGIKGFYYQYSVNAAQEFTNNLLSCPSCES